MHRVLDAKQMRCTVLAFSFSNPLISSNHDDISPLLSFTHLTIQFYLLVEIWLFSNTLHRTNLLISHSPTSCIQLCLLANAKKTATLQCSFMLKILFALRLCHLQRNCVCFSTTIPTSSFLVGQAGSGVFSFPINLPLFIERHLKLWSTGTTPNWSLA